MQELIPIFLHFLQQYGYIIVFLGAIVGGELFILAAAFLASLGYFNIFIVVALGFAGTIFSDSLWYLLGLKGQNLIIKGKDFLCLKNYHNRYFDHYFEHHYGKLIILCKFIYGTRTITMVTSGYKKVPYKKFFYYNLISVLLWLMIVVVLGYGMGLSWTHLQKYNSHIKYLVLLGVLVLVLFRFVSSKIIKAKRYVAGD